MKYDVFISCKSEDYKLAKKVYKYLTDNDFRVFLSSKELKKLKDAEYLDKISEALDNSYHLIVLSSSKDNIMSKFVHFEWSTFLNEILSGRKNGQIMSILKDVEVADLPIQLRPFERFKINDYKNSILSYIETPDYLERRKRINPPIDTEEERLLKEEKKKELIVLAEDYQRKIVSLKNDEGMKILRYLKDIGVSSRPCPVCNKDVPILDPFCSNCGWLLSPIYCISEVNRSMETDEHLTLCKKIYTNRTSQTVNRPEVKISSIEFRVKDVSFTMIKVKGGTFTMGATNEQSEWACEIEYPTHKVSLSDYYLGQTIVTQELWEAVMGETLNQIADRNLWKTYGVGAEYPMYYISYNDCISFIKHLNKILSNQLGEKRFVLPSEAQWEYAARDCSSCGYVYANSDKLESVAWYKENSDGATHLVAQKRANVLGLFDMCGNVKEWCADWYGKYNTANQKDPGGNMAGFKRVARGGSWKDEATSCRVSCRNSYSPYSRLNTIGFRLCLIS